MEAVKTSYLKTLPLSSIMAEPFLTPEVLKLGKFISPDQQRVDRHLSMINDMNFRDHLHVWPSEGKYYLLDEIEILLAMQKANQGRPEAEVPCLIIEIGRTGAKELAARFRVLNGATDTHIRRCFDTLLLMQCNQTLADIRRHYGVTKARSTDGKRVERDYRLIRQEPLRRRVMGLELGTTNELCPRPSPTAATLQYSLALNVSRILRDDAECILAFDREYEAYLDHLRSGPSYPDEVTKPIYEWSAYNNKTVELIAYAVARRGEDLNFDDRLLVDDKALRDQEWAVNINEETFELRIPAIVANVGSKEPRNLKKVFDITYKLESLLHSFSSYTNRIKPIEHGLPVRVQRSDVEPFIDTKSNAPQYEDYRYFDFIRRQKALYYCNRELLLKSIDLHAHNFGFSNYEPASASTYQKAAECFERWWTDRFLKDVSVYYSQNVKRQPRYVIYISIRQYLQRVATDPAMVLFADFIEELFKVVFSDHDVWLDNRRRRAENTQKVDRDFAGASWDQIKTALGKTVSEEDIKRAMHDLYRPKENRLVSQLHKLDDALSKLSQVDHD